LHNLNSHNVSTYRTVEHCG